jgi:xanthine dehydrogenase/oxidase
MVVAEAWLEHLASHLGRSAESLRCVNLYVGGERTPYGQIIGNCPLRRLWSELDASVGGIEARRAACDAFNVQNRWRKRGVAALPTKFGINFTAKFMNQAGALVNVYTDGTVLVTHGGTEMGQGLHTKIEQIAARAFRIPVDAVFVAETATDKVPNSSPTAASASSDLYGMAVLNACEQIIARLAPVRAKLAPDASFYDIVNTAYFERINLSAQGFYKIADDRCGYMWDDVLEPTEEYTGDVLNDKRGMPFNYFTNGVACVSISLRLQCSSKRARFLPNRGLAHESIASLPLLSSTRSQCTHARARASSQVLRGRDRRTHRRCADTAHRYRYGRRRVNKSRH